jgi:hypothetical protein
MERTVRAQSCEPDVLIPINTRLVTLGFDDLFADIYWLAFVQYVGDIRARQLDGSSHAQGFVETITLLAPQFIEPYYFASFIVGAEQRRPDVARSIIDRGISANPDNWCLPFIAGFNQYLNAHDNAGAARYYKRAALCEGAPNWLARQAELLQSKEPPELKQLAVWSGIYKTTINVGIKANTRRKLIVLLTKILQESKSESLRQIAVKQLHELNLDAL